MTTPVREQVLAALKTALAGISTISGLTVRRNVDDPVVVPPALVIAEATTDLAPQIQGEDRYTLQVGVFGYLGAATDSDLGTRISALHAAVCRAALADRRLGGVCDDIAEDPGALAEIDWDHEAGHRPDAAMRTAFVIQFRTRPGNPFLAP